MDKITAIYVRVSTEEQGKEGHSIANQIDRLTKYAEFNQWKNVQAFADEGYSAKDMNRPEMKRLIKLIKAGEVSSVATLAVDRLSRNLLDMLNFVQLCEDNEAAYVCAALNFDTGTPIGRMVLQILASFAEFERSMIATRVKETMANVVESQKRYQAVPPYGYEYDENKRLTIVEHEAEWVRWIADTFISGYGYRKIAKLLNEKGVATRAGKGWIDSTVRGILTNELYIGMVVWNRRYYDKNRKLKWRNESEWSIEEGCHDPILSMEQWNEIQKRINRKQPKGGARVMKYKLSGMLRCGECGSSMVSRMYGSKGPNKDRRIFVCSNYQKKGQCRFHFVFMDEAEPAVLSALVQLASGEFSLPASLLDEADTNRADGYNKRLAAINKKFQRQLAAYENGLIDDADLKLAKARVEAEKAELVATRNTTVETEAVRTDIQTIAGGLVYTWNQSDVPVVQNQLRQVIDHIEVTSGQVSDVRLSQQLFCE